MNVKMPEGLVARDKQNSSKFRVYWDGKLTAPVFNSRGAAKGYLTQLRTGWVKPQWPQLVKGGGFRVI